MSATGHATSALAALVPRRLLSDDTQLRLQTCRGVILFADIAGFTRLTENAHRSDGTRGVEQLTGRINELLGDLVDGALSTGGDVLKFGGDAILVAYDVTDDDHSTVFRAISAASIMKCSITRHRRGFLRSVSLHLGLAYGSWHEFTAGSRGLRREHFVWGPAITSAMKAADGSRVLPRICCPARLLPRDLRQRFTPVSRAVYDFDPGKHRALGATETPDTTLCDCAPLWDFLPAELRDSDKISGFDPTRSAEHRRVATVFGFWKAPREIDDAVKSIALLHEITNLTHAASHASGGLWVRSDPSGDKQKLLVLFGAIRSDTDDVDRALQFAEALHGGFATLRTSCPSLRLSVGIATATVFTGFVGNARRREFTVMGDGVNLAARLAAKAPRSATLCDQATVDEAECRRFTSAGILQLKNVRRPTLVFHPTSKVDGDSRNLDRAGVEHPNAMRECIRAWSEGQRLIALEVDPIADSRRFLAQFHKQIGLESDDVALIEFAPTDESVPGQGIRRLLERLQPNHPLTHELESERIVRLLSRLGHEAAARELVRRISSLSVQNTLVICDHFERATMLDRTVTTELISKSQARMICVEHATPHRHGSLRTESCIRIGAVTREELAELFSELLSPAIASRGLVELLHTRSQGAAKVARALLSHLVSRGLAECTRGKPPIWEVRNVDAIEIPNGLRAHYLQKIDRLPIGERAILRAIAVLGHAATLDGILMLCEEAAAGTIQQCLSELADDGLIESKDDGPERRYAITDPTCRQAVYETMSHHLRESCHRRAALNSRSARVPDPGQVGEHLYRAREPESASWLDQAARHARRLWSLGRARLYLRWALLARQGKFKPDYAPVCPPLIGQPSRTDSRLFESLAEILRLEGLYKDAGRIHMWLSRVSQGAGHTELACHHQLMAARLDWYAGHYVKSGRQANVILRRARRLRSKSLAAQAAFLLGETCRRTGRINASLAALSEAGLLSEAIGDRKLHADSLNALGLLHWNCGRLSEARVCFVRALRQFGKHGDPARRGQVANNLGILHEELGLLPQAQRYYERAFKIFERTGIRRHRAYSLGNLANLHRHAARYERARAAYEEVDMELRTMGEAHAAAYTVGNLGDLARDFGDLQAARHLYDTTLRFAQKAGDEELRAECLARLAHVHLLEGRTETIQRLIRRAMRSAGAAKSREFALYAQLLAIEFELNHGHTAATTRRLERVSQDASQVGLLYYELWTQYVQSVIDKRMGAISASRRRIAAGMAKARRSGYAWWELRFAIEGSDPAFSKHFRRRCVGRAKSLRDEILSGIGDPSVRMRFADLAVIRAIASEAEPALLKNSSSNHP